jgi:SulP family sulfate permease
VRLLPGIAVLRGYDRAWLPSDLLAGLTVGAMLVPQGMAYAELAGMPPITGYYAALLGLVVYAILGTSRHLGVGPEPGTAVLAATGVGWIAGGDPARYAGLMATLAVLVGALCLAAAVLRMGFLAELLSKPVLVGYISGVGLTLLSSQLGKALGVPIAGDGFFPRFFDLPQKIGQTHLLTLALFAGSLALMLALRRLAPKLPGALLAVALATLASVAFDLPARGVRVVGEVPSGLPAFSVPSLALSDFRALLPTALGIALIGYTDNVLTARSIGARLGYRIDSNQELVALGAINLAAGVSHGFPVSSSASRTAVPASLGSKSQLVGLVAAAFLVLTLLLLGPVLSRMPQPALAAVIVSAALSVIDLAGLKRLWKTTRAELALAVFAALGVMIFDVLDGVMLALGASVLLALARIALPHDAVLSASETLDGWVDAEQYDLEPTHPGLLVYRFDAPLFFANASRFRERLHLMLDKKPGDEDWVVLDFEGIGEVDATALEMLEELVLELAARGVTVAIARANERAMGRLARASLLAPAGKILSFATIASAVKAFDARST